MTHTTEMADHKLAGSASNDASDIDSDCADAIVQVALLDEIVYG